MLPKSSSITAITKSLSPTNLIVFPQVLISISNSMSEGDIKAFLYAWLGKKKVTPEYNIRPTGPKHRQRFLCELRVQVSLGRHFDP